MPKQWRIKSILKLKHAEWHSKPNYLLIPVTRLSFSDDEIPIFNKAYLELLKVADFYTLIKRTASGGISNDCLPSDKVFRYDVIKKLYGVEITIINPDGMWRIQIQRGKKSSEMNKGVLSGHQAYYKFLQFAREFNIDLASFEVPRDEGLSYHQETEKPLISLERESIFKDKIFEGVNHIDFHSSYPAGLAFTHPEFRPLIEKLYAARKKNPVYKDILNFFIGYMHSDFCKYKYAKLARDAIKNSNDRVRAVAAAVEASGRPIILYNTDGFWYKGSPYHGEGEGDALGEWRNDHINCRFRAKSRGAYEYIENFHYTPVVRGYTNLDNLKNRGDWEWGDIYRSEAEVNQYTFIEGEGVIKNEV